MDQTFLLPSKFLVNDVTTTRKRVQGTRALDFRKCLAVACDVEIDPKNRKGQKLAVKRKKTFKQKRTSTDREDTQVYCLQTKPPPTLPTILIVRSINGLTSLCIIYPFEKPPKTLFLFLTLSLSWMLFIYWSSLAPDSVRPWFVVRLCRSR